MIGLPLDHVAVAVFDLAEAIDLYQRLTGHTSSAVEELPSQGVRVAFVGTVELLEPLSDDSGVARFLNRRGPGLHHIAFRTQDIESELMRLSAEGYDLIDTSPRPGAGGHRVAFLHPKGTNGTLIELVEHSQSPTGS